MKKLLFATLIAGSLLNVSCKKDADDAPVLPDAETMEMNFSDFNSNNANRRTTVDTNKIDRIHLVQWKPVGDELHRVSLPAPPLG